jgi:hypothetical protein
MHSIVYQNISIIKKNNIMYNVGCFITVARILNIMYMLRSSILAVHILAELLLLRTADTPARSPQAQAPLPAPGGPPYAQGRHFIVIWCLLADSVEGRATSAVVVLHLQCN